MLDVLLIAEFVWCGWLFSVARLERTLILAGGVLTSGYVAMTAVPWLTRTMLPPTSPVFRWAMGQLSGDTVSVSAVGRFVPAEAASTSGDHVHWITTHILLSLMFVAVTFAVCGCFAVTSLVRDALWDVPYAPATWVRKTTCASLGLGSAVYLTVITGVFIGNLSWLQDLHWLQVASGNSVVIRWIGQLVATVIY